MERWQEAHATSDPARLRELAGDPELRHRVARNRHTPAELLLALAADPDPEVRLGVAENTAAPPDALGRLATDSDAEVRGAVAEHAPLPAELLLALAGDPDPEVRATIAAHDAVPGDLLVRLAGDDAAIVRAQLAVRPDLPSELLRQLASDPDPEVVDHAASNPALPGDLLAALAARRVSGLCYNPAAPPEVLAELAGDPSDAVRCEVARHPRTPAETLLRLAGDPYDVVRRAVASNARLPPEAIALLARDDVAAVRFLIAAHPLAPTQYLEARPEPPPPCLRLEVVAAGEGASSIGGRPRLTPGVPWPSCAACGQRMSMLLQLELEGAVPAHAPAGSRLLVFACLDHDGLPALADDEQLPPRYWELGSHYRLYLSPPGTSAAFEIEPRVAERGLAAREVVDEIREVGPRSARFFVGRHWLKIGGQPSWTQEPERHVCECGGAMRFVAQVPEGQEFPLRDGGSAQLFAGHAVFFLSCERACDPRAVWPVVQS